MFNKILMLIPLFIYSGFANSESNIIIDINEFYDESAITSSNTSKLIVEHSNFEIGSSSEFYIKSGYSSSLILERGNSRLFSISFENRMDEGINDLPFTSIVYFKKDDELFEVAYFEFGVSNVHHEIWNGDIAEFYIESNKYCVDINATEYSNFECFEFDEQAVALNPDDGFYIVGDTYPSRGGHLGNDNVEANLQDYVDLNEKQFINCVLASDKKINVNSFGDSNVFRPYSTKLCSSSPGVMAGPFEDELQLTASVDEEGFSGWHFYYIVYCKNQICYEDYSKMDTAYIAPPKQPVEPKIFSNVLLNLNWVDSKVSADITDVKVSFYPLDDEYLESDIKVLKREASGYHYCFKSDNYKSIDRCVDIKNYQGLYHELPSNIILAQGSYVLTLWGIADVKSDVASYSGGAISEQKIIKIEPTAKDVFINLNFDENDILRACPYIYTNLNGKDVFQGEIIMNLNHKDKEATQSLPVEFEVKDSLVEILIKEVKDETSYINYLALEVDGVVIELNEVNLQSIDDARTILKFGESMKIQFKLPIELQGFRKGNLISHGYYIPNR